MDFSLTSFKKALQSAQYRMEKKDFFLFSFILATTSDDRIFPDLLAHYRELDHLTGDLVIVVGPNVLMNDRSGRPLDANGISYIFQSGRYFGKYASRDGADVQEAVLEFLERQDAESLDFAQYCGIRPDELPCVVFFDSLSEPESYLIWSLRTERAASVVQDYRRIVAEIRQQFSTVIEWRRQLDELSDQESRIKQDIKFVEEHEPELLRSSEEELRNINRLLLSVQPLLGANDRSALSNMTDLILGRLREVESEGHCRLPLGRIEKKLRAVAENPTGNPHIHRDYLAFAKERTEDAVAGLAISRFEYLAGLTKENVLGETQQRSAELMSRIESLRKDRRPNLKSRLGKVERERHLVVSSIQNAELPAALDIVHKLDRRKFRRRLLKDLKESIPLVRLGFSVGQLFG